MKNSIYQEGIFKSKWLSKFINCLVFTSKKFRLEKLVHFTFFFLKRYFNINSLFFFCEALEFLKPWISLQLRHTIKLNKKKIQVHPTILSLKVQYKKAIYWLVKSIQLRKEVYFFARMGNEIKSIVFNEATQSLKKKKDYYNYAVIFKSSRKFKW